MKSSSFIGLLFLISIFAASCTTAPAPTETEIAQVQNDTPAPSPVPYPQNTYQKISLDSISELGIVDFIQGDGDETAYISISPDGKKALVAILEHKYSQVKGFRVYNLITGEMVQLDGDFYIDKSVWSPDSTKIALTTLTPKNDIGIWDITTLRG